MHFHSHNILRMPYCSIHRGSAPGARHATGIYCSQPWGAATGLCTIYHASTALLALSQTAALLRYLRASSCAAHCCVSAQPDVLTPVTRAICWDTQRTRHPCMTSCPAPPATAHSPTPKHADLSVFSIPPWPLCSQLSRPKYIVPPYGHLVLH